MKTNLPLFPFNPPPQPKMWRPVATLLLLLTLPLAALGQANYATPYTFSTLAGSPGSIGSSDGTGTAARFFNPYTVAVDINGHVYVGDTINSTIRKITPDGEVTTLAGLAGTPGSADGTGSAARFNNPYGVAVDTNGNVYVGDTYNHTIRKVTPAGEVTTLAGLAGTSGSADGTGSAARFYQPEGAAVDGKGNVYVAEYLNHTIRKVTAAGVVTTLAGSAGNSGSADGTGSAARFWFPVGLAVDTGGNLYVADSGNQAIRKVTPAGVVTTIAGLFGVSGSTDGTGSAARFYYPYGVAVDNATNVYVADTSNFTIRKVTPERVVTTLAGLAQNYGSADGTGSAARFYYPDGVAVDTAGNLYVADGANDTIRKGNAGYVVSSATPTNGSVPLTVQFTSASIDLSGHAITNWSWTFDDGSTSSLQNPSNTYLTAGLYHPTLAATNDLGSAVAALVPVITVLLPTIQFSATPTGGGVPLVVQFTCPNNDSSGNAITGWNWSFGDGSASTEQNPSHPYLAEGQFQPSLIVDSIQGTTITASGPQITVAAYSGLVLNGGFETGDFFGWSLNGQAGLYNLVDTFNQSTEGIQPHEPSSYFARLGQSDSLGYLSQTLATTPGAKYLLSFWLNNPDGLTPNQFLSSWNGVTLFSRVNMPATGGSPDTAWTNLQFQVTATGPSTVLQFGFRDDPTAFGLDDVSVVQVSPPSQSPGILTCQHLSNAVVVSWTNSACILQVAPAVTGIYTNVAGATSPYTNNPTGPRKFFRLISN